MKYFSVFIGLLFLYFCFFTGIAAAHNVTIFAWEEGNTVYTQCKFSGGKRVKGGTVIVSDHNGKVLLEGKTDDDGMFSFARPSSGALKIQLDASMGHANFWELPALDAEVNADPENEMSETTNIINNPINNTPTTMTPDQRREIEIAVENALDKKLKPVIQMLVDSQQQGPTLKDILGGLGYIFGLMGIAAYFKYRKQPK